MKLVCNTSPLIFLAKLGALDVCLRYTLFVPREVRKELLTKESPERQQLVDFFKKKNVCVVTVKNKKIKSKFLGRGECAVINYGIEKRIGTVLIDDKKARVLARTVGLKTYGTLWILLAAYKHKHISKKRIFDLVCSLPKHGFRIREDFFLEILRRIR